MKMRKPISLLVLSSVLAFTAACGAEGGASGSQSHTGASASKTEGTNRRKVRKKNAEKLWSESRATHL